MIDADRGRETKEGVPAAHDRGQHRVEVGPVVVETARRIRPLHQEPFDTLPPHPSPLDQPGRGEHDPLLCQGLRVGRHRTRTDPADFRVVGPAGDVPEAPSVEVNRRHQGDVRQVRAPERRMVGDDDVALPHPESFDQAANAQAHGAEMNGDMRCVDHQPALGVEQGAGKILPFLDVGRDRRPLQHRAHFLGDAPETTAHQLQFDGLGTDGRLVSTRPTRRAGLFQENASVSGAPGGPPWTDDDHTVSLLDQQRPLERLPAAGFPFVDQSDLDPPAVEETPPGLRRAPVSGVLSHLPHRCGVTPAPNDDPGRHDFDLPAFRQVRENLPVPSFEPAGDLLRRTGFDLDHGVLPDVSDLDDPPNGIDAITVTAALRSLLGQFSPRPIFEFPQHGVETIGDFGQRAQDLPLGEPFQHRMSQTDGTEKTGVGRNQHTLDAQQIRHPAGVLPPGASEGDQREACGIDALANGDAADGVGHPLVGDLQQSFEQFLPAGNPPAVRTEVPGDLRQPFLGPGDVDRDRESFGRKPAEKDVDVGDRQGASRPVAGGTGPGPGAFGADDQPAVFDTADRAPAGGNGLDRQGRGAQFDPTDGVFENVGIVPVETGNVGARTSHVEGDDPIEARAAACRRGADNAARWPAEQTVLGAERPRPHQPPGAGHHVERRAPGPKAFFDGAEIPADHRSQVGVDDGRRRPTQQSEERTDVARSGNGRHPFFPQNRFQPLFVDGVDVPVQQGDRGAPKALRIQSPGCGPNGGFVEILEYLPVRAESTADTDGLLGERTGPDDVETEEIGPLLGADFENVLEPFGDEQGRSGAASFEKGVGAPGRRQSHLDGWKRRPPRGSRDQPGSQQRRLFPGA